MKKLIIAISILSFFYGCDVIDGNVLENPGSGNPIDTTGNDTVTLSFAKKILIEEYTGHKCGNCPGGARIIADLKLQSQYKDKLNIVSIHAGGLASWAPPGAPKFTTNFTTTVGDDLDDFFGVSLTGIPRGLVNRVDYSGSKLILPGTMEQVVQEILSEPNTFVALSGTVNYDSNANSVSANITSHFNSDVPEDLQLSVFVTEDSVIDWQKNYQNNGDPNYPPGDIPDYVHMHVLRGSMNGVWGEMLNESAGTTIEKDSEITKAYSYALNANNRPKYCNVVAFVYRLDNDEIVQVREWHLYEILN